MKITRRTFLASSAAGAASMLPTVTAEAAIRDDSYATLIDLTRCNGCKDQDSVKCITACRTGNSDKFPNPDPKNIQDYWPQKKHEDWTDKKDLTSRLTPYNWIFVQELNIEGKPVFVPRRCMHCDSPACAKLCPFGVNHKTPQGPVYIDEGLCLGGAKCRAVCPWEIPQRQAGVGIYTNFQSFIPAGGGVMFKCDLCRERLAENKIPYCIESCPKQAMIIGKRIDIFKEAQARAAACGGEIYGMDENGGTSTLYVSAVPFSKIDQAITALNKKGQPRMNKVKNMLAEQSVVTKMSIGAPLIGAIAAFMAVAVNRNREDKK